MPTYEYQCDKCEANYDLRESFSAATTHTCEKCKKGTAQTAKPKVNQKHPRQPNQLRCQTTRIIKTAIQVLRKNLLHQILPPNACSNTTGPLCICKS